MIKIDYSKYDPDKAYLGVGKFKLPASHPFNFAGFVHDELYTNWPCKSTKEIDLIFLNECYNILGHSNFSEAEYFRYAEQAERLYRITRIWGAGRYAYAKIRGWKFLLRKN